MELTVNSSSSTSDKEVTAAPQTEKKAAERKGPETDGKIAKITLKDGRKVSFRRMGPLLRLRLFSIIGAENSKNDLYLSAAVPAFSVMMIDSETIPPCQTVLSLESLAERLGDAALLEISLATAEAFPDTALNEVVDEFKQRQKDAADKETIKNL